MPCLLGRRPGGGQVGSLVACPVSKEFMATGRRTVAGASDRGPPLDDLVELGRRHVEDEAADVVLARDERARLDARDGLADVLIQVGEGLHAPGWLDAGFPLDGGLEVVVGGGWA